MITHRARGSCRQANIHRAACGLAIALCVSCGGSAATTDALSPDVADVVVAPASSTIVVGAELPLHAVIRDANGQILSGASVVWSVRDTNVAVVSANGVVTARSVGTTQVAASANGKSGLATIAVQPVPVTSVSVLPAHLDVAPYDRPTLAAVAYDAKGNVLAGRAIVWASSNTNVATIDAGGVLTALAPGAVTISATSEGVSGSASVSVAILAVASITVQPRSATIQRSATVQLSAALTDSRGAVITDRAVTWTSSRNDVATVSVSGLVTGVAPGTAAISAASGDKADTIAVVVVAVPVGSVSVRPTTASLFLGQSATLTATVMDANGAIVSGGIVVWSSSDASVATVTQTGQVRALTSGTVTISATSDGKSGSAIVTITTVPVASVSLLPASATLRRGMTVTLTPTLKDPSGSPLTGRVITWTSSDSTIARVSSVGVVSAIALGSATITATSEGRSGSASIAVVPGPVATVRLSPSSASVEIHENVSLSATALDGNGDVIPGASFSWRSSDRDVATVSSSGQVSGVSTGTVTITATFGEKSGRATVTVTR